MTVLVTGGGGFLGGAIVKLLLAQGHTVRSLARSHYPHLATLGVEQISGNLNDAKAVSRAVTGCDMVFHVAAKAGVWGSFDEYYQPNVIGTQNIIQACLTHQVTKLIFTSSPSVVFNGQDMAGVDESVPYPDHYLSYYPQTKAEAERLVLEANSDKLATVALRPHLIWGPGDNHLVPRIIERGKKNALRRIGSRNALVDTVYIDNAAQAHLDAAQHLGIHSVVAGKAYFISNDEPRPLWDIVNAILATGGVAPVTRVLPEKLAYGIGALLEFSYRLLSISSEPRLTRFVAEELSTAHWFDLSAAKNDFGYQPSMSIDEGMLRLKQSLNGE